MTKAPSQAAFVQEQKETELEIAYGGMDLDTDALEEYFERGADFLLRKENLDPALCEISVSFVSGEEIRELNREHRGTDKVTDVLSFPQYGSPDEIDDAMPYLLGDVVLCMDRAREQAAEYGHSLEREVVYLFVHSILHLLGYDHMDPEEKREMREREEEAMSALSLEREQEPAG